MWQHKFIAHLLGIRRKKKNREKNKEKSSLQRKLELGKGGDGKGV